MWWWWAADRVVAAGASEGNSEEGVSSARAHRQARALPVVGGGAAGDRAAQAVDQLATAQHLENVIGMPAADSTFSSPFMLSCRKPRCWASLLLAAHTC